MRFEYDKDYSGGNYSGVGEFALVPVELVDTIGAEKAFTQTTGVPKSAIVHYSSDEIFDEHDQEINE